MLVEKLKDFREYYRLIIDRSLKGSSTNALFGLAKQAAAQHPLPPGPIIKQSRRRSWFKSYLVNLTFYPKMWLINDMGYTQNRMLAINLILLLHDEYGDIPEMNQTGSHETVLTNIEVFPITAQQAAYVGCRPLNRKLEDERLENPGLDLYWDERALLGKKTPEVYWGCMADVNQIKNARRDGFPL